ncbi:AlpA family phage regulatory protein [Pusillimonas sp. SM2304]|uniref:helix-turn-helix transcriptional regulator n=1 Tax=Pusillimonas sp. SM2304 TaxID=3073241 RepID=UPI002875FBE7|nr:AlpA family phage regulatory protein [Pusillimonas sp. SM2304]MDS1141770.1 AlpA family phage regulatory protein [Pusillimonas sp. SM2304]
MSLTINQIDPKGLYRLAEIMPVLPISESSWRRLVAAKAAPQPIKLTPKCTLWRGGEILAWLKQPDGYIPPDIGARIGA